MGYFVKLDNPDNLKTKLLETARDVIILLRSQEKIDSIKLEKDLLISEIQIDMAEIKKTTQKLYALLTNTKLKQELAKHTSELDLKIDVSSAKQIPIKKTTNPTSDDLEKLEQTLDNIEQKLKNLS
jgi:transcriptional/translational regulatory protein YebC/TACO1